MIAGQGFAIAGQGLVIAGQGFVIAGQGFPESQRRRRGTRVAPAVRPGSTDNPDRSAEGAALQSFWFQ